MDRLPNEIIVHIFSYLYYDTDDIYRNLYRSNVIRLDLVCQRWKNIVHTHFCGLMTFDSVYETYRLIKGYKWHRNSKEYNKRIRHIIKVRKNKE